MNRFLRNFLIGGAMFFAAAILLLVWYVVRPGDQIILLSIIAMPTDILFFYFARKEWSLGLQFSVITLLGFVQYGFLGMIVCFWVTRLRRSGA